MKVTYLYSIVIVLLLTAFSSVKPIAVAWISIEEAQRNAHEDGKPIFIDFTADWCGWCKVMDKNTFSDPAVAAYMNENFYTVRLDYDSKEEFEFFGKKVTARQLGEEYKVPGLPTILIIAADNSKSKKLVGYKEATPFLEKLQSFKE